MRNFTRTLLFCCFAIAQAATATMFVVPSDREMVRRANAIVIASALTSYSQLTADGGIETVTAIAVEQVIKGAGLPQTITVVEPGGEYNGSMTVIPGVPRFLDGQRVLLFLSRVGPSRWAVTELVLGKFTFASDEAGQQLLVRDEEEIAGWDSDLRPFRERRRSAARFLDFVLAETRGAFTKSDYTVESYPLRDGALVPAPNVAPYTATSYTMNISGAMGGRWNVFPSPVNFFRGAATEPGAPGGGDTAINVAFASWNNDCASNVNYVYAGVDTTHTQDCTPRMERTPFCSSAISAPGVSLPSAAPVAVTAARLVSEASLALPALTHRVVRHSPRRSKATWR